MSDDRKDMTTTAACQLVDLLYASVSACQQTGDKLVAVEAERDKLAAKLAEVEKDNAQWSVNYDELIRRFDALQKDDELRIANIEVLQDQLIAANNRIAEAEKANAEWSEKYDDSIRKYKALKEANSLWIQQSEGLRKQLAAANKRIADLTAPVVGDYHCGYA